MNTIDQRSPIPMLESMLQPWHGAINNPVKAQDGVLHSLLTDYAKVRYGKNHSASNIDTIEDYRRAFPIASYQDFQPLIKRVMAGDTQLLLWEDPIGWAITRGTTKGESKFIPMTETDLKMRLSAGRAVMNFVLSSGRTDLFMGVNLNLNFPSSVGIIKIGDKEIEYGYSSGIYTRYVSTNTPVRSVPSQAQIDALGGGKSIKDWEKRFNLAYELCKDKNVTLVGGVCPTAIRFGRYLHSTFHMYPKDLWTPLIMTLGSVPGINTHYRPSLKAMYGPVVIREIYGATEGMFGQQMDAKRAWVPNYDLYFFEVHTRSSCKMLHEMKPGEMGTLVISTPILPRYRIGDIVRAFKAPYFRCIGRDTWHTKLRYFWGELVTLNLDQL